jgi:hypothetical protein
MGWSNENPSIILNALDLLVASRYSDGLWAERLEFDSWHKWDFSVLHSPQTDAGTQAVSYLMGSGALSLVVKQPGHVADHSPPSSANTSQYVLMAWCLIC